MEQNSSLSQQSRRSSDVFEVTMSLLLSDALGADWMLMLQAKVIYCRSSDEDFLLEKSSKSPVARRARLGFA